MDDIRFSTWKDFGQHVLRELDALKEQHTDLQKSFNDLHDSYIAFKAKVELVGTIAMVIFGSLEGFIALYLIFEK